MLLLHNFICIKNKKKSWTKIVPLSYMYLLYVSTSCHNSLIKDPTITI